MYLGVCDWFSADSFEALPVPSWPGRGSSGRTLEISPARCARVDAFALARLVVGAGFLAVAAVSDLRTRRVHDPLWVVMGTIGLVLVAVEVANAAGPELLALVGATAILFYSVFYGEPILDEKGAHLRPVRMVLFGVAALLVLASAWWVFGQGNGDAAEYSRLLSMPALILVYEGFYQLDWLRGGADAKALIAITVLIPTYPEAAPFPLLQTTPAVQATMQVFFPFSLVALMDGVILSLVVPLAYFGLNLARREFEWPIGFLGTKVPIDAIPRHSWLMERVDEQGEHYAVIRPSLDKDTSGELAKLRATGASRVWIERQNPLVVWILLGFLCAFFLGNLILGLFSALLPPA